MWNILLVISYGALTYQIYLETGPGTTIAILLIGGYVISISYLQSSHNDLLMVLSNYIIKYRKTSLQSKEPLQPKKESLIP